MTIILAGTWDVMNNPLSFFYDDLADVCFRCSNAMMVIAFTLAFAGMILQTYRGMIGGDLQPAFKHLIMTGIVAAIIPNYAEWMLSAQSALGFDLLQALEVDPIGAITNFGESFGEAPFDTSSAPSIVFGILDPLTWFEYFCEIIGMFCMVIFSVVMVVLFWFGFQVQIIAIYIGAAAAPIFLGMLLFESTRDTAVKYLVGMLAICFWPLGWGIGMLLTEALLKAGLPLISVILLPLAPLATNYATVSIYLMIEGAMFIILLIIVIIWMLVVLFAGPKIISKALTTGAQIGMGFVNAATSAGMATATAGIQAASGAAMMAGGAAITAATGGAGAAVGVGMMAGGAGTMGGAAGTLSKGVMSAGE